MSAAIKQLVTMASLSYVMWLGLAQGSQNAMWLLQFWAGLWVFLGLLMFSSKIRESIAAHPARPKWLRASSAHFGVGMSLLFAWHGFFWLAGAQLFIVAAHATAEDAADKIREGKA